MASQEDIFEKQKTERDLGFCVFCQIFNVYITIQSFNKKNCQIFTKLKLVLVKASFHLYLTFFFRNISCPVKNNSFIGLPQTRTCVGCGHLIHGPYISTSTGVEWHSACLKCTACGCHLGDMKTCFIRDNKPYCKNDYFQYVYLRVIRYFNIKCIVIV